MTTESLEALEKLCAEHRDCEKCDTVEEIFSTTLPELIAEAKRWRKWKGEVICTYCGHTSKMADTQEGAREILLNHMAVCEKHPIRIMASKLAIATEALEDIIKEEIIPETENAEDMKKIALEALRELRK